MLLVGTKTNDHAKPVFLDLAGLLHHSLVVGQSGSGKSFFVARLIEEVILNTAARVVIVDPNGDFRSIATASRGVWTAHALQFESARSKRVPAQPAFDEQGAFSSSWGQRRFLHLYPNTPGLPKDTPFALNRRLAIHWEAIDEEDRDFLIRAGRHLGAQVQTGMEVCILHARYLSGKYPQFSNDLRGLMEAAQQFAARNVTLQPYPQAKNLTGEDWSGVRSIIADLLQRHTVWSSGSTESTGPRLVGLAEFIDGPFQGAQPSSQLYWDVLTLALDSAREADSLLIVDTLLARLWRNAKMAWRRVTHTSADGNDTRVPTFVVIDEAQNFAPTDTSNPLRRRVTERLLQVAAEGRKYGIYLILATQRPTKLHPSLVPECENSCVLRIQSSLDTQFAIDALGIEEKLARNCPTFHKGRGLVSGRWLDNDSGVDTQFFPARSTVGGGGLSDGWQTRNAASIPVGAAPESAVEEVVLAELRASTEPVTLVELAEVVRAECPETRDGTWLGKGTFKALLQALNIRDLVLSTTAPGYALLDGRHQLPSLEELKGIRLPVEVGPALMELHLKKATPLLAAETFGAILKALSEVVQESVMGLTDLSRAVRDLMLERGTRAGRGSIGYVIKGIMFSGHRFDPDLPQDEPTLAAAFVRSLLYRLEITVPLEGEALARALVHCSGAVLDLEAVKRLQAQVAGTVIEPLLSSSAIGESSGGAPVPSSPTAALSGES